MPNLLRNLSLFNNSTQQPKPNGLALSPTIHRAYDNSLIYFKVTATDAFLSDVARWECLSIDDLRCNFADNR